MNKRANRRAERDQTAVSISLPVDDVVVARREEFDPEKQAIRDSERAFELHRKELDKIE